MELDNKLIALAETSRQGATERKIETKIVHLLEYLGWPDECIDQDVALSDKDRADILLRAQNNTILFEVKQHGETRRASAQVLRYCRLARPKPSLAILTDGFHWTAYYVGNDDILPFIEASMPQDISAVVALMNTLRPARLKAMAEAKLFDYFDLIQRAVAASDVSAQSALVRHFANTIQILLVVEKELPVHQTPPLPVPEETTTPRELSGKAVSVASENSMTVQGQEVYSPYAPPPLTFTTIRATFAGKPANSWQELVRAGIQTALVSNYSVAELRKILISNIVSDRLTDNGFSPVEGYNISVQGMQASRSWQDAFALAQHLKCDIEVIFKYWTSDKVPAEMRGKGGVLRWSP